MASTDALPVPRKNTAYRVYFEIRKNDGTLITGATGLDSEESIDGGTFADITDEAHEIATASGVYYLDLTSGEMNGDNIVLKITSTTTGALTTVLSLYPQEAGDIRVNPTYWDDTDIPGTDTAGYPRVTIKDGTGTGELDTASGVVLADLVKINGSATLLSIFAAASGTIQNATASGTPTTTTMPASNLSSTHDDQYNGRVIIWTSGALIGLATDITDYTNSSKTLTFTVVHTAPSAGDTFIIV